MGPQHDPKALMVLFKRAVEEWGWPDEQQAAWLLPLLTSKVQLVAQQLPADNRLVYADLKCAILQ